VKKQEKQVMLISSAKDKAAKASAKAKDLRTKLVEATKLAASPLVRSAELVSSTSHSDKKSKGNAGAPSTRPTGSYTPQLSPQRKRMSANKRVNLHSTFRLSASQLEILLSSDSSYSSDTSGDKVPLVSEDTDDKHKTSSVALRARCDILLHGKRSEACGGRRYSSPLARDRAGQMAGNPSLTSKDHVMPNHTYDGSSSNGSWTEDNNDDGASLETTLTYHLWHQIHDWLESSSVSTLESCSTNNSMWEERILQGLSA
jgi:hypothetical protein